MTAPSKKRRVVRDDVIQFVWQRNTARGGELEPRKKGEHITNSCGGSKRLWNSKKKTFSHTRMCQYKRGGGGRMKKEADW